ncbi:helix-turn-helix domain-containing protein [Flavobacterium sp.]|uniref:helix-turn-helix domain-containing protein n=2 Tax=Flavobacterium sp. TaxID=239 RepID=UPI0040473BED
MVNIDDFIKRLDKLLEYYNLSASAFADKIDVQRSSISHLLSGRNKPSLDFVLKVVEEFPDVDLYWILNGKGSFPKEEEKKLEEKKTTHTPTNENLKEKIGTEEKNNLFSDIDNPQNTRVFENFSDQESNTQNLEPKKNNSDIDRIVVFYKNGTFKNYTPE